MREVGQAWTVGKAQRAATTAGDSCNRLAVRQAFEMVFEAVYIFFSFSQPGYHKLLRMREGGRRKLARPDRCAIHALTAPLCPFKGSVFLFIIYYKL